MKNPEPYVTKPLLEKVVSNANKLVDKRLCRTSHQVTSAKGGNAGF